MKITFKKFRYLSSLSEETYCFSAVVYLDGKNIGVASNRGCGGSTDFHPNVLGKSLNHDVASIVDKIDDEVHQKIVELDRLKDLKGLKRQMLKSVCFIADKSDGLHHYKFFSFKNKPITVEANYNVLVEAIKRKYPDAIILNNKPDTELQELLCI